MNMNSDHRQHLKPPVRASLGNNAKSLHIPERGVERFEEKKRFRYSLQRQAGRLLWEPTAGKKQKFRVCHCCRSIQGEGVTVYRKENGTGARFAGLTTCGSGWTCPVCAVKIGEVRREELSAAMVQHVGTGGRVNLTTMTFPHELDMPLAELMEKFDKARQKFKNSRSYKAVFNANEEGRAGCIGCVSSLEITHGANGWHPHLHMLSFAERSINPEEIAKLTKAWVNCLLKCGLGDNSKLNDMMEHSLDVRGGEDAAAYVAKYGREEKWGITSELTRSHTKKGISDSLTPFGMLALASVGDDQAAALFQEFANVFIGRRLITFSPGLRARFGMNADNESEEAAAAAPEEAENYVGWITPDQWRVVLQTNSRAELLAYAASCCSNPETAQTDLNEFIESLRTAPVRSRGWFYSPMRPNPANFH